MASKDALRLSLRGRYENLGDVFCHFGKRGCAALVGIRQEGANLAIEFLSKQRQKVSYTEQRRLLALGFFSLVFFDQRHGGLHRGQLAALLFEVQAHVPQRTAAELPNG